MCKNSLVLALLSLPSLLCLPAFAGGPEGFWLPPLPVRVTTADGNVIPGASVVEIVDGALLVDFYSGGPFCALTFSCKTKRGWAETQFLKTDSTSVASGDALFPTAKIAPNVPAKAWQVKLHTGVVGVLVPFTYSSAHTPPTPYTCLAFGTTPYAEGTLPQFDCPSASGISDIQRLARKGGTCVYSGTAEELNARLPREIECCQVSVARDESERGTPPDNRYPIYPMCEL